MAVNRSSLTGPIDLREILTIIVRHKWLVIIPLILVTAASYGVSFLIPTEFESSTIVQIDTKVPLIRELQGLVGEENSYRRISLAERRDEINSIYNQLVSSHYMVLLDERLQLSSRPEIEIEARLVMQTQPGLTAEEAALHVIQKRLKEKISVSWVAGDQIEITVQSHYPSQAQQIANSLSEIFIDEKVRMELNQIRSSQDFSDVQVEKYELQLAEKVNQKTALEREYLTIQLDEAITSDSNRIDISREIDRTSTEINDVNARQRVVQRALTSDHDISVSQLSVQDTDDIARKRRDLKDYLSQIGELLTRFSWTDPQTTSMNLRMNSLLIELENDQRWLVNEQFTSEAASPRSLMADYFIARANLDFLHSKKTYLQAALDEIITKTTLVPEYQAQLDQLESEIMVMTDLRDRFRRQQESSTISQALIHDISSSKHRQIEPAKLPMVPVTPDRTKILIMGFILGMAISGGAVLLVELFDNSFKKVEHVEQVLGLPVLGISPKVDFDKRMWR